ncbi:hypothetical protein KUG85_13960 [Nitratireductor sp. L1-7-SE]|uniref:Uncharacterized protein n=1 Tax=Nitratireductor rhodophyticola TaxID=2854036 RepID=A0ABS7R7T7_9HYPH|nr:DUF6693 family protein [Nitratireductor rhodophyticola]MBY8916447.1 hypothetical protein [Nitratireductor rhodophyticola]MBY8921810.1 hypothetical protein [Nitratireductor rhodophyticola]
MNTINIVNTGNHSPEESGSVRLRCNYSIMEATGYIIIWAVVSIVTLGIGAFFAIYYFYKSIINKTYLINREGHAIARLECELNLAEIIGHVILWIILTVVTLGIGLLFYMFRTLRLCMNKTRMVRL